jgi:undecaprenyl-diphosphatase
LRHAVSEVTHERRARGLVVRYGRAWLTGYALVVAVVVVLAFAAHAFSILPGDLPIARELQENRNPIVFWAMYAVSFIGYEPQAAIIFALAVIGLWAVRLRLEAVFLVVSELADGIARIVKIVVARSRPSASLVDVVTHLSSYSFPSGHTVHYTVFYGFLGFVIATNFRAHWLRQACLAICIALIVLVGPSRVYLGEHWPTDVLAGYLIGGLFLVPLIAAYLWAKEHVVILAHWPFVRRRGTPAAASGRPRGS